jgi:nitrous oxidase accessory protein
MPRASRILVAVGSVLLLSVFVFPLWSIHLTAPQYPEGLGMYIRVNTIVGAAEFDLAKINNLNHYIGMRPIEPGQVPELRVMPFLFGALVVIGLLVAALGRRRGLYAWLLAFALVGLLGLADFYRWGYDYGHNLDVENAIITIPGMSYQPPLIGTKQLLNFTATSWPALGGWLAVTALGLGGVAAFIARRARRQTVRGISTAAIAAVAAACGGLPAPSMPDEHAGHHTTSAQHVEHRVSIGTPSTDDPEVVVVSPRGPVRSVTEALALVRAGGRVDVQSGIYREPTIVVDKPVAITGEPGAVLDGQGTREIMTIVADDVTVRGLTFRDVGGSVVQDNAAIKVVKASRCLIEDNRIENGFFAIYLADVSSCRLAGNVLEGNARSEATSGNGIHLWSARDITIEENEIRGHRDGIYFEFVRNTVVRRNVSEQNLRYGLHFMYSDDCRYAENVFRRNLGGVAVMYTKGIEMIGNRFEDNWGSAAYGLLLKEIYDPIIEGNRFQRNTTGIVADGAVRIVASKNEFIGNGWALKLLGSTYDGRVESNDFVGNTFDVTSNGSGGALLAGNYFDSYRGYDLDRDGIGEVPHHPVRLFSVIVERNPPSIILLRTLFVDLLDVAERVLPSLTPATLVDGRPAVRPVVRAQS